MRYWTDDCKFPVLGFIFLVVCRMLKAAFGAENHAYVDTKSTL